MPRTIGPADSASQVSTNRVSIVGRRPPPQGTTYGEGSRGSMLGRASAPQGYRYGTGVPPSENGRAPIVGGDRHGAGSRGSMLGRSNVDGDQSRVHFAGVQVGRRALEPADSTVVGRSQHGSSENQYQRPSRTHPTWTPGPDPSREHSMAPIREESVIGSSRMEPQYAANGHERNSIHINQAIGDHRGESGGDNRHGDTQALITRGMEHMQLAQPAPTQPDNEYVIQKRFIPLTWTSISKRLVEHLCKLFKIQPGKVKDWCRDGLIRADMKNYKESKVPYDLELLTAQLAPKDIERWDRFVRDYENDMEYAKALGPKGGSFNRFSRGQRSHRSSRPIVLVVDRYDARCVCCWWSGCWCGDRYHGDYFCY